MANEYKGIAEAIAAFGRNGDTMLMHVNPAEVQALDSMWPGSITINPDTGQPEAFFWLLPAILSAVTTGAGGAVTGLGTALSGALGGGAVGAGLTAPLTAVGSGLTSIGTSAASLGTALGAPAGMSSLGVGTGAATTAPIASTGTTLASTTGIPAGGGLAGTQGLVWGPTSAVGGTVAPATVGGAGTAVAGPSLGHTVGTGISKLASGLGETAVGQITGPLDTLGSGINMGRSALTGINEAAVPSIGGQAPVMEGPFAAFQGQLPPVDITPQLPLESVNIPNIPVGNVNLPESVQGLASAQGGPTGGQSIYSAVDPTMASSGPQLGASEYSALQSEISAGNTVDLSNFGRPSPPLSDPLTGGPNLFDSMREGLGRAGGSIRDTTRDWLGKQPGEGWEIPRMDPKTGAEIPRGITDTVQNWINPAPGSGNVLSRTGELGPAMGRSMMANPTMSALGIGYLATRPGEQEVPEAFRRTGKIGENSPWHPDYEMQILHDPIWERDLGMVPIGNPNPLAQLPGGGYGGFYDPYPWP